MPISSETRPRSTQRRTFPRLPPASRSTNRLAIPRRMASNFAWLGLAEIVCRGISVLVTLSLLKRLDPAGFGRIEFAFNIVFWLVLIVRDCFETIITREIARHPRLTRTLVNHVLAVKLALATVLLTGLAVVGMLGYANSIDRWILLLYGLLLLSTALGLDFVFRGNERMGLVALSLLIRTTIYSAGVWFLVTDPSRILLVPICLVAGEFTGIGLVWVAYQRRYGMPRPVLGLRFLIVLLQRGRSVGLIHLCQAVIVSADLIVVGLMGQWDDVGRYGAPLRMISAVMAFGLIFQQVVFPALSRSGRSSPAESRRILDDAVRILVTGFLPIACGAALLAEPLVRFLFPPEFHQAGLLLAVGIWRAPLLSLAFLYQASLIAMNRETAGLRLLIWGSLVSAPMIALMRWELGIVGASLAVLMIALGLVTAGYLCLLREGKQPASHHHVVRPLVACGFMAPVCLLVARWHVVPAVAAGALTYMLVLILLGGLDLHLSELVDTGEGEPTSCGRSGSELVETGGI